MLVLICFIVFLFQVFTMPCRRSTWRLFYSVCVKQWMDQWLRNMHVRIWH